MRSDRIEVYKNHIWWYWRRVAPNGRIIADGSEGYMKKTRAITAALRSTEPVPEENIIVKD